MKLPGAERLVYRWRKTVNEVPWTELYPLFAEELADKEMEPRDVVVAMEKVLKGEVERLPKKAPIRGYIEEWATACFPKQPMAAIEARTYITMGEEFKPRLSKHDKQLIKMGIKPL